MSDNHKPTRPKPSIAYAGRTRKYRLVIQGAPTTTELGQVMEFLWLMSAVAHKALPPIALDVLYDSMDPSSQRHFQTEQTTGIVMP